MKLQLHHERKNIEWEPPSPKNKSYFDKPFPDTVNSCMQWTMVTRTCFLFTLSILTSFDMGDFDSLSLLVNSHFNRSYDQSQSVKNRLKVDLFYADLSVSYKSLLCWLLFGFYFFNGHFYFYVIIWPSHDHTKLVTFYLYVCKTIIII